MNSSYLNMAAGAFLGTVFVVMSVSLVSEALYHSEAPAQEGFAIEVVEAEAGGGGGGEEEATPIAVLLQDADPAAGEASFRKCASCHDVAEGGPNKVGPNLWDVVNRPIASHEGFSYSSAMTEFSEGGEVVWDYEHLAGFLADPRGYINGTAMSFAGLKREDELANVIAYLHTLSNDPAPLPEPEAAPAEGGEGEAAGEAAGEEAAPAEGEEAAPAEQADADAAAAQDGTPAEEAAPEGSAAGEEAADGDAGGAATEETEAGAGEAAPADDSAPAEQQEPADEAQPADEDAAAADEAAAPAGDEQSAAPADTASSEESSSDADAATAEAGPAVALLAEADPANGETLFRRCQACHTVDEGGQNRVGPNLWDIVNAPVASDESYSYSDGMIEYAQGGEVVWDYNHLDAFLLAPRDEVEGTKMAFPGLKDDADRADLIAYLHTLSNDPAPLPGE